MKPIVRDRDFALYQGDCRELVHKLPEGKVDCVVTSPPYYGLRDYGTGSWDGGSENCSHAAAKKKTRYDYNLASSKIQDGSRVGTDAQSGMWASECPDCGAVRVDKQLGLEDSPERYVGDLVGFFSDLRRAIAPHGTVWVNLGDSYKQGHLVGVPWRFAFAMVDSGWNLKRDVIWYKRDPMPESAKTRPTTTHEYLFMFTKTDNNYYDWYAVQEDAVWTDKRHGTKVEYDGKYDGDETGVRAFAQVGDKRLLRSVWDITTVSFPDAHFATFPPELPSRCIRASCPELVCTACGKPKTRIVERVPLDRNELPRSHPEWRPSRYDLGKAGSDVAPGPGQRYSQAKHIGWSDCGCGAGWRRGIVLDPFLGSGTTAITARALNRHSVGYELNEEYCDIILRRTAQLSLYNQEVAS